MSPESMVEMLAKRWEKHTGEGWVDNVYSEDARWCINAIAEELERVTEPRRYPPGLVERLRSEATR